MTKAVAYMRCSSKASFFGDTWVRQAESINECAESQSLELTLFWQERAIPGKTEEQDRPAFQDMVASLLENGCKIIIVESLDRLAREYRVQEQLVIYLASKKLTLISANTGENITDAMMGDPMRRAMVQIQGILAELDKNMLIARTRKARERLRAKNGKCEGRKSYPRNANETAVVNLMLSYESSGFGTQKIAERLNQAGIKTRYGKVWNAGTIFKILRRLRSSRTLLA